MDKDTPEQVADGPPVSAERLCECHKVKRPRLNFPHVAGQSMFCIADLTQAGDYKTLLLEANNMDWHEGTWTMTEGQSVTWTVDGDEVLFSVTGNMADEVDVWLSERQAENMIAGLSYQLNRIREERGRG